MFSSASELSTFVPSTLRLLDALVILAAGSISEGDIAAAKHISDVDHYPEARIPALWIMLVLAMHATVDKNNTAWQTQVDSRFCLVPQLLKLSLPSHMIRDVAACSRMQRLISLHIPVHATQVSKQLSERCGTGGMPATA